MGSRSKQKQQKRLLRQQQDLQRRHNEMSGHRGNVVGPSGFPFAVQQTEMKSLRYTSPVPPPEVLTEYAAVMPDAVERIFRLAERQSAHRQTLERRHLLFQGGIELLGRLSALAVALAGLYVVKEIAVAGHPTAAAVVGSVELTALVYAFIHGRRPQKEESGSKK